LNFGALGLENCALASGQRFGFLQGKFAGLDLAVKFLAGNHALEETIFGAGHFGFGVGDFVLEGAEGVVGFHFIALIAILLTLVAPLLDIEFVFFSILETLGMGVTGGCEPALSKGEF